jgi:hypothetical protein
MSTQLYLGFDPGRAGAFGWCIAKGNEMLPLTVISRGIVNNAQQALEVAQSIKEEISGVGIDSPLFWRPDGDRIVDSEIRQRLIGLHVHGGTVNHVNSMRGACLIQGMMTAMLIREEYPKIRITESHPKAMLWLLQIANDGNPVEKVTLAMLNNYFVGENLNAASDHERDASLAALSAWAMENHPEDWDNLYIRENNAISPLNPPPEYWMPNRG